MAETIVGNSLSSFPLLTFNLNAFFLSFFQGGGAGVKSKVFLLPFNLYAPHLPSQKFFYVCFLHRFSLFLSSFYFYYFYKFFFWGDFIEMVLFVIFSSSVLLY